MAQTINAIKNSASGSRGRRVKAILAGGLVLGVGAAMTLAAWNDSEFASGTFTAGSFNMVGSTNGTDFADHATAGAAATLAFTVNPTNLAPGDVVASPFAVRLTAATTTTNASVTVSSAGTTDNVANLTYTVIDTGSTFGCTAATTGTALIPAATAVGTVPGSTTFTLPKGASTGVDGVAKNLCFKVTAGAIAQGQTGTATWQFLATSQ
jgi:predicted ribosomally synthesized peptide with SipW-like signal peptide